MRASENLTRYAEKIKAFLEAFEGEKDVTIGLAEMDLEDEAHDDPSQRLKYKRQLVCLVV